MNIFSYESKVSQILLTLADLIILNILYLVCCIPLFTISAAQAGLFTGIRVILDKEDDRSAAKSFFRGFSDGFLKSSIAGTILLGILFLLYFVFANTLAVYFNDKNLLPVVLSGIALLLTYMTHSLIGPFHASFGCTVGQLIRNALMVCVAYPLRSLAVTVLTALPLVIILIWPQIFVGSLIAFIAVYYSCAYLLCFSLLKKPFDRLKKNFNRAHGIEDEESDDQSDDDSDAETTTED